MFKLFKKNKKQDLLGDTLKVMKGKLKVNYDYEGYSNKNIFNKLSKSSDYGFYYWPHGYLFRHYVCTSRGSKWWFWLWRRWKPFCKVVSY